MFALKLLVCGMLLAGVLSHSHHCMTDEGCYDFEFCDHTHYTCEPRYMQNNVHRREAIDPNDGVNSRRFEGIRNRRDV